MKYFEIELDSSFKGGWILDVPRFRDGKAIPSVWSFTQCERWHTREDLIVPVARRGVPKHFSITHFSTPVLSDTAASIIGHRAGPDIQLVPASIDQNGMYQILNVLRLAACLDHERSVIQYYPVNWSARPDLAGKPEMITTLAIGTSQIQEFHVFRIIESDFDNGKLL